jgi:hypothetical protein
LGFLSDVISGAKKTIPWLAAKVGTILLFFFTIGFFAGYFVGQRGYSWIVLFIPVISMVVMWKKLDEGFLVFVLGVILIVFFPELFTG